MSKIVNMMDYLANKRLQVPLSLGWLEEKEVEGQMAYKLTVDGSIVFSSVIVMMFIGNEVYKRPEMLDLDPTEAMQRFCNEVLSEDPFCGSGVMFMAVLADQIKDQLGISSTREAEYLAKMSIKMSDYLQYHPKFFI